MKHGKTAAVCAIILFVMMVIILCIKRDKRVNSMEMLEQTEDVGYEIYYTDRIEEDVTVYESRTTPEPPLKPEELSVVTKTKASPDPKPEEIFKPVKECGWSKKVQKKIWKICKEYGIDFYLIMAMAEHESDFRAWITGDHERASGAWQIHYREWKDLMDKLGYGPEDMYDPVKQADAACAILEGHYKELNRTTYALMAYNGGSTYAKRMIKADKISGYAKDIIAKAKEWKDGND